MLDQLLTAEEVASYLQIPLRTLYEWRTKGAGPPAMKVGRHLRYRERDLELWLREQSSAAS